MLTPGISRCNKCSYTTGTESDFYCGFAPCNTWAIVLTVLPVRFLYQENSRANIYFRQRVAELTEMKGAEADTEDMPGGLQIDGL